MRYPLRSKQNKTTKSKSPSPVSSEEFIDAPSASQSDDDEDFVSAPASPRPTSRASKRNGPPTQQKFRLRMNTVDHTSKLNKVDVYRYLNEAYASFTDFFKRNIESSAVHGLCAQSTEFESTDGSSLSVNRWRNSKSIPLNFRLVQNADLKSLENKKLKSTRSTIEPKALNVPNPNDLCSINFLQSHNFGYTTSCKKPPIFAGVHVATQMANLKSKVKTSPKSTGIYETHGLAMFCGGPISALAMCPQCDSNGDEVVAVSTFADEVNLMAPPLDRESTHVQFWSLPKPIDGKAAKCRFLLEIPYATVTSLAWCPLLLDSGSGVSVRDDDTDCLGLLAVATTRGSVLIFRLSRELFGHDSKIPPILRTQPVAVLAHPIITVSRSFFGPKSNVLDTTANQSANMTAGSSNSMEADSTANTTIRTTSENGDHSKKSKSFLSKTIVESNHADVPLTSCVWSHFHGGNHLAAISDAGYAYIWDLSSDEVEFDPKAREDTAEHFATIRSVRFPTHTFKDETWESPPSDVKWTADDEFVICTRNRNVFVYKMPEQTVILSDATLKTAGTGLHTVPSTFRGFYSYDTMCNHYEGCNYSGTNYLLLDKTAEVFLVTPILDGHQLRVLDMCICPSSGVCSSVGLDGRVNQTLIGRVFPRLVTDNDMNFCYGRTIFQLVRYREPAHESKNSDDVVESALVHHTDCVTSSWLEVRAGDAGLLDMLGMRKHRYQTPEATIDRRTESITRISSSLLTPGSVAVGGEAGLVFFLPCLL
ncbi:hypothetical protein M3Y94_00083100 [Aphelenchoides besseyi]|nr:hypothetical protein M3Y94_00083100 [Aphelenchoides besseyi]KAI6237765.1 hypothetical protein M3Y95_00299400 [Aphelenchoides besseyi]